MRNKDFFKFFDIIICMDGFVVFFKLYGYFMFGFGVMDKILEEFYF